MLLNVLAEDAGTYSFEAKNEYGEATSSAPLTVEGRSAGPWRPGEGTRPLWARGALPSSGLALVLNTLWLNRSCITTLTFPVVVMVTIPVPKMVGSMARVSAPVLVAPMEDVLVFEKHQAQFQCRISGEGSSEHPAASAPVGRDLLPSVWAAVRAALRPTLCVQICRFLGSVVVENWRSQRSCRCPTMATGTSWRSPRCSPATRGSTRVWLPTRQERSRVPPLSIWMVSKAQHACCLSARRCTCTRNTSSPSLPACRTCFFKIHTFSFCQSSSTLSS